LDIHHVEPRAHGGGHEESNLVTLCGAHHLALHEGALVITGSVDSGLDFWHADGRRYGSLIAPPTELLGERAVRALRGLGFGEKEARRAAEHAMRDFPAEAELEGMIRRCLARLTDRQLSRLA
jgi:hypothetical protein